MTHASPLTGRSILCLSGCAGATQRYRVEHLREMLASFGCRLELRNERSISASAGDDFDALLLHRIPWNDDLAPLVTRMRQVRKPVVFDIDDLLFTEEHLQVFRGDRSRAYAPDHYRKQAVGHRETLSRCTAATVSTTYLQEAMTTAIPGLRSFVIENAASDAMTEGAAEALMHAKSRDFLRIGYMSGTHTHDSDFLACAGSLYTLLRENAHLRLVVIGLLKLPNFFSSIAAQVERKAFVPWEELPAIIRTFDINLAPLETGNPFAESKSDIKYLEAGLLGVPTVASAIPSYVRSIRNGINGFVCATPENWNDALRALVGDAALRKACGERAREDILRRATTEHARKAVASVWGRIFSSHEALCAA